jgi:predicted DNA-binding transcriptional regulator YafY
MTDLPLAPRQMAVLTALEAGCTRRAAASAADVHHATLYRWMDADATFRDAVEKAENVAEARATTLVIKAAYEGQWTAAAWWLERRRPDNYGKRVAIDVSIRDEIAKMAAEYGVDADEAIAEAERILAGAK